MKLAIFAASTMLAAAFLAIAFTNWTITKKEGSQEGTSIHTDMAPLRWMLYGAAGFLAAVGLAVAFCIPAHADPGPVCGMPDVPCAGPNPMTPQQQCAYIAWRMSLPCNWLGMQVPQGTPGSWG